MCRKRSLFVVALLAVNAFPAAAQTEITVVAPAPTVDTSVQLHRDVVIIGTAFMPADVVNRILAFDRNGDDRIAKDELPERMQTLIERADLNGDGVLVAQEVERLVDLTASTARANPLSVRSKSVGMADVVSDLRLPQPKHDLAMALAKNYAVPRNVKQPGESRRVRLDGPPARPAGR